MYQKNILLLYQLQQACFPWTKAIYLFWQPAHPHYPVRGSGEYQLPLPLVHNPSARLESFPAESLHHHMTGKH